MACGLDAVAVFQQAGEEIIAVPGRQQQHAHAVVCAVVGADACVVIARLHHRGVSKPYIEPSSLRVRLRALVEQRELYWVPMQFYLRAEEDGDAEASGVG